MKKQISDRGRFYSCFRCNYLTVAWICGLLCTYSGSDVPLCSSPTISKPIGPGGDRWARGDFTPMT